MPQQEGVMNIPREEETITSTASAFDTPRSLPVGRQNLSFGVAPGGASQIFGGGGGSSPEVDPSAQKEGNLPFGDIYSQLMKDTISDAEILKAITPVSGAAPAQLPPYYTRPLPQPGELIQDKSEVVSAGSASGQGIGNAVNAVIHGIAGFKAQRDQQQQLKDATKVQRLIEVQNGISQAEQMKRMANPNDPNYKQVVEEAQKTIDHNTGLRDEMLSDKKFSKLVEKGFNISLTDPSQNKTPEHGAVQHGIGLFKKANNQPYTPEQAKAMGQRFQAQQPTQMQPNVLAQQMLSYKMAQNQQTARLMSSLLGRMFTAQSNAERDVNKELWHRTRDLNNHMHDAWKLGQQFANNQALAQVHHDFRMGEIGHRMQLEADNARELLHEKNLDPVNLFKSKSTFYHWAADTETKYNQVLQSISGKIATANADLPLVAKNPEAAAQIQQTIKDLQYQYASVQQEQKNFQAYKTTMNSIYDNLDKLSSIQGGGGGNSGAGPATGPTPSGQPAGTATPVGPGAFNPNAYLNVPAQSGGAPAGTQVLPPIGAGGSDSGGGGGSDSGDDTEDEDEFGDNE